MTGPRSDQPQAASFVIPVSRLTPESLACLERTCASVARLGCPKEVLLALDSFPERISKASSDLEAFLTKFPFVRVIRNEGLQGMRITRMNAIKEARYPILIFTDDDCCVPDNWAERMLELVLEHGVVTGPIQPLPSETTLYSRLEALIDDYRAKARTSGGGLKFASFGNFGIRKDLLPRIPFDQLPKLYGNDMDLGCRIRVKGTPIHMASDMVVRTEYPKSLAHVLRRKLAHAHGIAFVERRMGETRWRELQIGTHWEIIRRWAGISWNAPVPLHERSVFFLMNMTYALGLAYYFHFVFRDVEEISPEEL